MYPAGHEKLKGRLEDRYFEVKALLAQEHSIPEIADILDVNRASVYEFVKRHDYGEFVQPGRRKAEWRAHCEAIRAKQPGGKAWADAARSKIEAYASAVFGEMRAQGFKVERDDVVSEVNLSFTKAMKGFDPEQEASFYTYFYTTLLNDIIDFKKRLARALKKQGYEDVGKKHEDQQHAEAA